MRIKRIETECYRVPLPAPWGDQTHRVTHLELVLTKITGDTDDVGTGFSYTVGVGGKAIQALIEWYLAPKMIGADASPRVQWHQMWSEAHDAGGGGVSTMALAALDIALWDLAAKARHQPLVDLLGRFKESVPAYGSGINLNLSQPQLEDQIRRWVHAGYGAVKVKVGKPDVAEDQERVAAVRRALGPRRLLMVDANQGWTVPAAARAIAGLAQFDLFWVEEPLLADDVEGHARLRRLVNARLAIGENVYTRYQFRDYLAHDACDFVQADVVRVGGITPWLDIAALAQAWNVSMAPHFMLELTGQLLCCIPNGVILEDVEGGSFRELGILAEDVGVREGRFTPPSRPGHGIVFDVAKLTPHRIAEAPPARAERLWHAI
jgi:L-alanine-DL-glutamate epimerase-like enolase superfamily enzyme